MRWIRSRAKLGAWLALFALALQFGLAFGHVHADQLAPAAIAAQAATPSSDAAADAPAKPDSRADDFCAICALIHLAGSLVPSAAPSLPAAIVFRRTHTELAVAAGLTASPGELFQARAPPIV